MNYYAVSDIGHCRLENQDAYDSLGNGGFFFAVVCDGMGGALAGKQAAEIACRSAIETVRPRLEDSRAGTSPRLLTDHQCTNILREALENANGQVYAASQSHEEMRGMGTTIAAVLFYYGNVYTMHVGDSRIYLFREGKLTRLTHDHSLVQEMVDKGEITYEEARVHPSRNMITRAVGVSDLVVADYGRLKLQDGDMFLLCSDGLTGMVDEDEIRDLLATPISVQAKTNALIAAALHEGGEDNVTVFLTECQEDDMYSVWEALTDVETEDITAAYLPHSTDMDIQDDREDIE